MNMSERSELRRKQASAVLSELSTKRGSNAYTVTYDSSSHWKIITQRAGSSWPKVLPYCVFNVVVMALFEWLVTEEHQQEGLFKISNQGHTFLTLIISFLLVSRVNIALGRYTVARNHLEIMYRESREVIQGIVVLSFKNQSIDAKEWRSEVAYRTLILLRTAMAVIDYSTTNVPAWDVPELSGMELRDVRRNVLSQPDLLQYSHAERSVFEENLRVPIRIAYLLRKSLHAQSDKLSTPISVVLEMKLMQHIDGFLNGYYGIRSFLTTPVPFPLVQMSRTFLFLYVFTIPFALLSDNSNAFAHCFFVFLLTYGFMGLSVVAIELDDPFGDDENDFNNLAMAQTAFEDTYLTILDVDGPEWTQKLRQKMNEQLNSVHDEGFSDDNGVTKDESTWLMSH